MKWSAAIAMAVAAAGSVGSAKGLSIREMSAISQELNARALLDVSTAAACATAEPCGVNGCMGAAGIAMNPTCRLALTNFSDVITADASNGDSAGVMALLVDGPLDANLTVGVCESFKNDTMATTCMVPAPLQALLNTMRLNSDTGCMAFNEGIMGLLGTGNSTEEEEDPVEADTWTPTGTMSDAQKAAANAAFDALVMADGGNATAVSEALAGLGVSWVDFVASIFGFTATVDPAATIEAAAGACMVELFTTTGAISDTTALGVATELLANSSAYSEEELSTMFLTQYGPTATTDYLTALALIANWPAGASMAVTSAITNDTYTEDELVADVAEAVVTSCVAAQENQTDHFDDVVMDVSTGVVDLLNATAVATFIASKCADDISCSVEVASELTAFGSCLAVTGAVVEAELPHIQANLTALITSNPGVMAIGGLADHMSACFGAKSAAGGKWLQAFFNAASPSEEESHFMSLGVISGACALYTSGLTDNLNPTYASKSACYQASVFATRPDLLSESLNLDALLSLESSTPTLKARCDAVGVDVGTIATFVTQAPTTSAPTSAPTETVVTTGNGDGDGDGDGDETLNASNLLLPSLLIGALAAFFIN